MFNCMSNGRPLTRRWARARIAATAASSSWAIRAPGPRFVSCRHLRRRPGRRHLWPVSTTGQRLPPPGEWQTYDIAFRRPRFDESGKLLEPARLTLIHNGILIQNNEEILAEHLARVAALRGTSRSRADPASGSRPSGPLPQYVDSRLARTPTTAMPKISLDPRSSRLRRRSSIP